MSTFQYFFKKKHAFVITFDVSIASGPHLPNRKIAQMRRVFFEELNDKDTDGHHTHCLNGSTEIK